MKVLEKDKKKGISSHVSLVETDEEKYSEFDGVNYPEPVEEMPLSEAGLRVSEEEYWEKYYNHPDFQYEWNNGILEEKPMADYQSSKVYRWFVLLLEEYLKAFPIAKPVYLEIGFRMALPEKTAIRKPDLALILHSNPIDIDDEDCTYQGIFDLCIEFLSDSKPQEVERDTIVKKEEYCRARVKEYFILDRKGKETAFYRLNERGGYSPIPQPGGVIRSEVLPDFQFRIEDLYTQPLLHERINDNVYKAFILQEYQAEHQRAEAEYQRAEAEYQRAEAEHQEKLKFAAKLRELGIDPDSL